MEFADSLLIGWWLFVAITCIFVRSARSRTNNNAAAVAVLKDPATAGYRYPRSTTTLSLPAILAIIVVVATLILGPLGLVWIYNWTRLLYLNFQFFLVCFGAATIWGALSSKINFGRWGWLPAKATGILFGLFGAAMLAIGLYQVIGDVARPRLVVEGRVTDKIYHSGSIRRLNHYYIVINGTRYKATREIYQRASQGERIRVELGATSKMIFDASKT